LEGVVSRSCQSHQSCRVSETSYNIWNTILTELDLSYRRGDGGESQLSVISHVE